MKTLNEIIENTLEKYKNCSCDRVNFPFWADKIAKATIEAIKLDYEDFVYMKNFLDRSNGMNIKDRTYRPFVTLAKQEDKIKEFLDEKE